MMSSVADPNGVEIDDLERLHAQRRQILPEYAALKAMHGPFGKFEHQRKKMLAALRIRARMVCEQKQAKITEGLLDDMARADEQYERFVDEGIVAATRYIELENQMSEIAEKIENRTSSMYYAGQEMRLTR